MSYSVIKMTLLADVALSADEATVLRSVFKEHVALPHRAYHYDSGDRKLGCPTCKAQVDLMVKLTVCIADIENPIR